MPANNILTQNFSKKLNFFDWRMCEDDVPVAVGKLREKTVEKNILFCNLKINEEKSRIRIRSRIRIH